MYIQFAPQEIYQAIKRLHSDINRISEWAVANGLKLNPRKTQMILLGSQKHLSKMHSDSLDPVLLNGVPRPFVDSVKNLGVIMDKSFSEDLWVKQTCRNAIALINRFHRCGGLWLPLNAKRALVNALVHPFLDYGAILSLDYQQPISVRCSGSKTVASDSCTACVEESRSGTSTPKMIISCLAFGDSG